MEEVTIRAMQSLAQEVWRIRPEHTNPGATVGELAWEFGTGNRREGDAWLQKLWLDGEAATGCPLAWGWIFAPMETRLSDTEHRTEPPTLDWQVHPDNPELLDEVLDWFDAQCPDAVRQTSTQQANVDALTRLQRHGYEHDPDAPWGMRNIRDLDDIETPQLPDGYRALTMREIGSDAVSVARRVEAHRVAWEPSRLTVEAYQDVMATPPYRDDLDFVIEAPDATLVASGIGWYDEANHVAEFEPVGTHPDYRRRGLGRALSLFGMQRFRDAGARQAIVGCRGDDNYPIPKKLYRSVGFRELTRELWFVKNS